MVDYAVSTKVWHVITDLKRWQNTWSQWITSLTRNTCGLLENLRTEGGTGLKVCTYFNIPFEVKVMHFKHVRRLVCHDINVYIIMLRNLDFAVSMHVYMIISLHRKVTPSDFVDKRCERGYKTTLCQRSDLLSVTLLLKKLSQDNSLVQHSNLKCKAIDV